MIGGPKGFFAPRWFGFSEPVLQGMRRAMEMQGVDIVREGLNDFRPA
jgi:hypothetical protein